MLGSLKVLDFSTLLPGPYATMILADLGAKVVRVEAPGRFDYIREMEPKDGAESAAHQHLNRNKQSIALDLKKREAVEVVKRLVQEYDIVIEQFRPGVMERLGLDYDKLKAVNPELIYCSLTGYGQDGPYRDKPGHDINYLSLAGINGYSMRKGEPPVPMGIQIADIAGGSMHSVTAILAAVIHRKETGEGQYIDISMTDASFALNAMFGSGYLAGGVNPEPEATELNGGTFYDYYETKDGRFVSVGSLERPFQKKLCEGLGMPNMAELAASNQPKEQQIFKQAVREAFLERTLAEWQDVFQHLDACVEPVLSFAEAAEHPQIQARDMIVDVTKENGAAQKQIASPFKFSTYQQQYTFAGGPRGANTFDVLKQAGLSGDWIHSLADDGVFGEVLKKRG
ncbi:CaiB/BaiF CoA transferase family protein [Virgibacillus xinjiangensis]|uniref:CaiB/BaiF CoA transferase family protein n=1 Tax=Virgibacillus xinjiangensis TaxID=393090 RepID=A0ABV7CXX9_9BACI